MTTPQRDQYDHPTAHQIAEKCATAIINDCLVQGSHLICAELSETILRELQLERTLKEKQKRDEFAEWAVTALTNICQLMDGWHTDSSWSGFDEQCRKDTAKLLRYFMHQIDSRLLL